MNRHAVALFLIAVAWASSATAQSQNKGEGIRLRWVVAEGKAIAFRAAMQQVHPSNEEFIKFDWEMLLDWARDAGPKVAPGPVPEVPREFPKELKEFFSGIKMPKEFSMTAVLKGLPNERISVKLIMDKGSAPQSGVEELNKFLKSMEGTVQLRGEINDAGGIESFYLQQNQKNLLALLCELPSHPVKVGDSWSLHVYLITMGQGFIAEKAERTNRVHLVGLARSPQGELVATLDYVLVESVKGKFQMPLADKATPTTMAMSYLARGEFSVTKGAWKKLSGRMSTRSTGFMSASAQQHFALQPLATVPEELLKLH